MTQTFCPKISPNLKTLNANVTLKVRARSRWRGDTFFQSVEVKICTCFGQQLVQLCFSGTWSEQHRDLCSILTHISPFFSALRWVKDKGLCAVRVLWPPVYPGRWCRGASKTCSSFWKTEKTTELWCHQYESVPGEAEQEVRKRPRSDFLAFTPTASTSWTGTLQKTRFDSFDWLLRLQLNSVTVYLSPNFALIIPHYHSVGPVCMITKHKLTTLKCSPKIQYLRDR